MKAQRKPLKFIMLEDNYQEKVHIPKNVMDKSLPEQIGQTAYCRVTNMNNGIEIQGVFAITGTELYFPVYVQKMLKHSKQFEITIF